MPGRKPLPTGWRLITGNPGKRPVNEQEPQPQGEAVRPKFVKGRAAKVWDQYATELTRLGVLTSIDSHMFAAWCCLAAEFESAPTEMTASRIAQMRALASSFGLEASSRTRLKMTGNDSSPKDPKGPDRFFGS